MTPETPETPDTSRSEIDDLKRRLDLLEEENQRLKAKMEPMFGPDNPAFDPIKFQRALQKPLLIFMFSSYLLGGMIALAGTKGRALLPRGEFLGIPIIDMAGVGTRHPGVGIGIIGMGGLGVGVIGVGGLGMGIFALGGGAVGVFAFGGGSLGIIAFGGGACGLIAVGGGAFGYYALGQRAQGRYVLALNRQDDRAIELFCQWFPGLRASVTRPMPVIPMQK